MPSAVAAPKPVEPKVKGVALEKFLAWHASRYGAERTRAIVAALPPSMTHELSTKADGFGILANTWYSAPLVHALLDAMTLGMNAKERDELVVGATEAIVRASLRGIYKVLFQLLMNPDRYAARAQSLWDRYYDSGTIEKRVLGPKAHDSRIIDWSSHHPLLCQMNAESARIIYEELGCTNVRVDRTACVSRGDAACAQFITWV